MARKSEVAAWVKAFHIERQHQPNNICAMPCNDLAIGAGVCGCANKATRAVFPHRMVTEDRD